MSTEPLRSGHPRHAEAVGQLHDVLVRVASDELTRRRGQLGSMADPEFDELARQAADGALTNILRELDGFRGLTAFTSWASRFVIFEVSSTVARHAWRRQPPGRDVLAWDGLPDWLTPRPGDRPEQREQLQVLAAAIGALDDRRREVFVAIASNDVPIDVLALQRESTRAAVYQDLFDARVTLRRGLMAAGHAVVEERASA